MEAGDIGEPDISREPLSVQFSLASAVMSEYREHAAQGADMNYTPLRKLLFTIALNEELQSLPFLPDFIDQVALDISSLQFQQSRGRANTD